jgi:hypothetical protein
METFYRISPRLGSSGAEFPMTGNCGAGLLLAEGQFLFRIDPLLENDLAVFAFRNVHGGRTRFEFVRHFTAHVDADGLGAFSDWVGSHR